MAVCLLQLSPKHLICLHWHVLELSPSQLSASRLADCLAADAAS